MVLKSYVLDLYEFLKLNGNAEIALKQANYMRNRFPFIGLMRDDIKHLITEYETKNGKIKKGDTIFFAKECISYPERELWYIAINVLKKNKKHLISSDLDFIKQLIILGDWWDIVDLVSSHNVGTLVLQNPELKPIVQNWMYEDNFWLRRASIIYQLTYRLNTDAEFLFFVCKELAHEKEFFIRKAIGWALREYSKWNPVAVDIFIKENRTILSPLSIREGMKILDLR